MCASIVRFWNKQINMSNDRLAKGIFLRITNHIETPGLPFKDHSLTLTFRDSVNFNFKRECIIANVRKALMDNLSLNGNNIYCNLS